MMRAGDHRDRVFRVDAIELDHEFVTTQPRELDVAAGGRIEVRDRIGRARALGEPVSNVLQQFIADRVTERVVDAFEAVEVDKQYGKFLLLTLGLAMVRSRLWLNSSRLGSSVNSS